MTNRKSDCRKNSESNRIQSRRKLKKAVSRAAAREGRRTLWGTLRLWTIRERCWRTFSASC